MSNSLLIDLGVGLGAGVVNYIFLDKIFPPKKFLNMNRGLATGIIVLYGYSLVSLISWIHDPIYRFFNVKFNENVLSEYGTYVGCNLIFCLVTSILFWTVPFLKEENNKKEVR